MDGVLHFASAASPVDYLELPIQTLKVGSLGTHNTLGLAKAKGARFLLASTSEVYGDPEVHPQRENYWGHVNPIGPRGVYDEAKRFAEALSMAYHRVHDVPVRIARIFNTFGPGMRPGDGRVVSNFIVQAIRGEPLTVYGGGNQTRSFLLRGRPDRGDLPALRLGLCGPREPRKPHRVLGPPAGADRARRGREPVRDRPSSSPNRRPQGPPGPTLRSRSGSSGGSPKSSSRRGSGVPFRTSASGSRRRTRGRGP